MKNIAPFVFASCLLGCAAESDQRALADAPLSTSLVQASGELASADTVLLGPPMIQHVWQHKITLLAPEGSQTKAGQPVLGFDASNQQQELIVKRSELATAKQKLDNTIMSDNATLQELKLKLAEAQMQKEKAARKLEQSESLVAANELKKLRIDQAIADDKLMEAEKLLKQHQHASSARKEIAAAELARFEAEVARLQGEIQRMTVLAPKEGLVVYKTDWQGNKFGEGDTVYVGQSVMEIPSLENMIVKAEVLEVDAGRLRVGQPVQITLDAQPDRQFHGQVRTLGQVFRSKSHKDPAVVFDAEITISNPDAELMRPGMAVRLRVDTSKEDAT
ncbi:HlyD family secretion protein [Permianibacter aggregans]|uniref:HlyD family secretion protein n=1 Tax=Permianibacter aggregans TaxID=1510150 RepID=A0A4R6ULK7_9GAMM|nr:efflux RND transporter periplasmic adaptor subunit [Permianibacter aggregans]QGX39930.1 HlyD family efflux transporter periplasmic adaptor subunit [Permianibacter aggregans]TDQ46263.1 HlyD family secretion protein [Permianibacter aggregans]